MVNESYLEISIVNLIVNRYTRYKKTTSQHLFHADSKIDASESKVYKNTDFD